MSDMGKCKIHRMIATQWGEAFLVRFWSGSGLFVVVVESMTYRIFFRYFARTILMKRRRAGHSQNLSCLN